MPFINGKFYANPAYGRAVERARNAENIGENQKPDESGDDGHWVTIDGRHVLIQDSSSGPELADRLRLRMVNKIYNEFSGLRPKPGASTHDDLNRARQNAAHVYRNRQGGGFQGSSTLGRKDARDIAIPGTDAAQGYQGTVNAIAHAQAEPDTTQNANHVYIYDPAGIHSGTVIPPEWVTQGETTTIAGPFINVGGGGDVPRGDEVFVITVNDRNMSHSRQ
jgi:hypothetical protein